MGRNTSYGKQRENNLVLILLILHFVTHALALQSFSSQYNTTQGYENLFQMDKFVIKKLKLDNDDKDKLIGSNHKRRSTRSVSMWDYFPLLSQNLHETDYEELPGIVERDVHTQQFRPLCQTMKRRVELRDDEFEYRPPHYIETVCKAPNSNTGEILTATNNLMCAYPGFSCVQRSQTIYLTRRRFDSNCWESFTQTIASNCECMWPVLSLGEISHHY